MSKVDLSLIGNRTEPVVFEYTWKDVVLYALGVGASASDLPLVYENAAGGLQVLPSFCVVPAIRAFPDLGENLDWSLMLHGEQCIRLYDRLPPEGTLVQIGELENIYDKGKGAVFHIRIEGRTAGGRLLYEVKWVIFYLGAGGFGGAPGPRAEAANPPENRAPDFVSTQTVPENQAALYRLNGDYNPLHLDPAAAGRGGFARPILHGLCTFGYAVRTMVTGPLGGNAGRLKLFRARFSDVVYPGDTLTLKAWREPKRFIVQVNTARSVAMRHCEAVFD
jgi:acyl dehydratase